jgi:hypothetical protein
MKETRARLQLLARRVSLPETGLMSWKREKVEPRRMLVTWETTERMRRLKNGWLVSCAASVVSLYR